MYNKFVSETKQNQQRQALATPILINQPGTESLKYVTRNADFTATTGKLTKTAYVLINENNKASRVVAIHQLNASRTARQERNALSTRKTAFFDIFHNRLTDRELRPHMKRIDINIYAKDGLWQHERRPLALLKAVFRIHVGSLHACVLP